LAAKIEKALGSRVELIPEGKGVFDISVDGNLEYSKYQTGTFPEEGQLVTTLISKYKAD
jgi:predicted Rdx family selenoprotein